MNLPPRSPLPAEAVPVFDRFAQLAAQRLATPVALVTMVDAEGQVFPGAFGLPEPWQSERATPLSHSFCQHVVTGEQPLLVENAHDVALVRANLAVLELGVVAYAGVPLRTSTGTSTSTDTGIGIGPVVGALCAIDHRPRRWTDDDLAALTEIAADVSDELAARMS